jgi:hypothetical protein
MASRSHTLYIGVTGDLLRRVYQHKWREHDGFTARYNCDRLVWFERRQFTPRALDQRGSTSSNNAISLALFTNSIRVCSANSFACAVKSDVVMKMPLIALSAVTAP